MKKSGKLLATAAVACLVAALLFWPWHGRQAEDDMPQGGDFTLETAGDPLSLHDLRGKVVLLYFGYTHCPDVCPVSMASGAKALSSLSPEERSKVRLIFVSVDPARDTPAKVKEYAAYFHPDMIGATGTPKEISALAKAYGAAYVVRPPSPEGSYTVDHTAQTYVIGPDGRLVGEIEYGAPVDKVVATIREYLP